MIPKIYGYVAGGVIVLLILSSIFGLVKYGEKVGKQDAEITRLEGELVKEKDISKELARLQLESHKSAMAYLAEAGKWQSAYEVKMAQAPQVIYRNIASTVPVAVPTGNCDLAAYAGMMILRDAQLLDAGVIP